MSWPTISELTHRTCQSKSSVQRHLKALEEIGVVSVTSRRQVGFDGRSRQASNLYEIDLEGLRDGRYLQKSSGCQNDTLTDGDQQNRSSGSGCQNDTLEGSSSASGCQYGGFQGVTGDTPIKTNRTTNLPSLHPSGDVDAGSGDEFLGKGSAAPPGTPPTGGVGGQEVSSGFSGFSPSAAKSESASHALSSSGSAVDVITPTDIELVREVLPEAMQAIPLRDYSKIAAAIRQRLDAGYSRKQITAVLAARCLPDRVRHLTALVMGRFRDDLPINVPPPTAVNGNRAEWSHTLPDGRVITRRNIDFGLLAVDFRASQRSGDLRATSGDRLRFAVEQGIEKYLM